MYSLSHEFRFIDPIKTKSKQSKSIKILELFGLTLNTANIGLQLLKLKVLEFFKVLLSVHRYLFHFFYIFSIIFIILIYHILFICFNKSGCDKTYCKKLIYNK